VAFEAGPVPTKCDQSHALVRHLVARTDRPVWTPPDERGRLHTNEITDVSIDPGRPGSHYLDLGGDQENSGSSIKVTRE
jgi:hypothetical protein